MHAITLTYLIVFITSSLAFLSYQIPKMQSNVFILLGSWVLFTCVYMGAFLFNYLDSLLALYALVAKIDFYSIVVDGMLCYLLFAGCLHIDIGCFFDKLWVIITLAICTTLCSFLFTAFLIYAVFQLMGVDYPLVTCFLYAAVIAPTDPVAVLALLKNLKLSKVLYAKIASESLLNDGVGVVLFLSVLRFQSVNGLDWQIIWHMFEFFFQEAVGGLLLGGLLAFVILRFTLRCADSDDSADNQNIFLLLALLNLGFLLAKLLHVSPPLVAVGSGLYASYALQYLPDRKRAVVYVFWDTIDEILNYILFFIVGFQAIFVDTSSIYLSLMFCAIVVNFTVRLLAVCFPLLAIRVGYCQNTTLYKTLVIGGLKGGLSLALALSIPRDFPGFDAIFDMTYAVVAFTVIVQGLSIERYLKLLKSKSIKGDLVI